ncbi:hypothetical protein CEP54_011804 [Fusarium duplospermum]|uniref:CMP/dCMP-type deaminase domain-containing protein n=1 Tax=Fusarium duplospermum TaxID=1325734 RepID=A0A428PCE8_9HYPO|nr:hypothetical protein CEP54_011804 [Fusarium duplospermum]
MGVLKSLGLSPAKKAGAKAFRRLFGRVLPAGESDSATGSAATSENGKNHTHDETNSSQKDLSKESTRDNNQQQSAARSSTESHHNSTAHEDQHPSHLTTATVPPPVAMASPQKKTDDRNKENQPPNTSDLTDSLTRLSLDRDNVTATPPTKPAVPAAPIFTDPAVVAERAMHMKFIEEALDMARLALRTNETPVGCVLVHDGKVIAKGMNATNVTRNGTRHAEIMALGALLSYPPKDGPRTTSLRPKVETPPSAAASDASSVSSIAPDEGNEDGSKGHLYPYGQKCHPDERVDRSIIRECILYVTVEPCVMCASLLRQLGIKKVYFGAVNDKFGGTGGVFSIHANSLPISADGQTASAHPTPKPTQLPDGSGTLGVSYPPGGGDGGNIESGYEIEGGWGRDDAVGLLRRFYVQENGRAPVPRKKEGRAARLAAMMEKDGEESPTPGAATPLLEDEPTDLPTSTKALEDPTPLADRTEA